jgi:hypothetical protein
MGRRPGVGSGLPRAGLRRRPDLIRDRTGPPSALSSTPLEPTPSRHEQAAPSANLQGELPPSRRDPQAEPQPPCPRRAQAREAAQRPHRLAPTCVEPEPGMTGRSRSFPQRHPTRQDRATLTPAAPNPVRGRRVTLSGSAGSAHRVGTASPAAPRPGP